MATLALTRVWINLWATGQAVSAFSKPGRAESYEIRGGPRVFAGGRVRSITGTGVLGKYAATLILLPRVDVDTLTGWMGQTVQVRDHRGRRMIGAFYSTPIFEYRDRALWDVGIAVDRLTVAEGV